MNFNSANELKKKMKTIKTITNGNKAVRISQSGNIFRTLNFIDAAKGILSNTNSSKVFNTLFGAEKFANKFVNA